MTKLAVCSALVILNDCSTVMLTVRAAFWEMILQHLELEGLRRAHTYPHRP